MTLRGGAGVHQAAAQGEAAQVDPINPTFKAPGTKRLKQKNDELLSSFAFKINLRRYTMGPETDFVLVSCGGAGMPEAGAYTRPLFSST